jgi:hypothetical protein
MVIVSEANTLCYQEGQMVIVSETYTLCYQVIRTGILYQIYYKLIFIAIRKKSYQK